MSAALMTDLFVFASVMATRAGEARRCVTRVGRGRRVVGRSTEPPAERDRHRAWVQETMDMVMNENMNDE